MEVNQQEKKRPSATERAERRQRAEDKRKTAAADRDGVAFVAVSREAKVLAWNTEQMDLMLRTVRANVGGMGRIPAAKAQSILDEIAEHAKAGHRLNKKLHNLVKLVNRDYRYLPHTDIRKMEELEQKTAQPAPTKAPKGKETTKAAPVAEAALFEEPVAAVAEEAPAVAA